MSLSIAQKGLLMVFIPLALNVAWIGLYWNSLSGSSALLNAAAQKGNIIFMMSRTVGLFNKTATSIFDFVKTSGDESIKASIRRDSLDILQTLRQISSELPAGSSSKYMVEHLTFLFSQIRQTMDWLAEKPNLSESDIIEIQLPRKFLAIMNEAHGILNAIDISDRSFGLALDAQKTDCRRTRFIVQTGLLLNLAIALALALFFKLTVAKRISEVSLRTRSLTSGTPVFSAVNSSDELSKLESQLIDAREKLASADNFRRVYMTAVALRLQSSLRRCLQSSDLLQQESAMSRTDGDKYFQRLSLSVSSCLSLVDDMLLLESLDLGNLRLNIEESNLHQIVAKSMEVVSNLALIKKLSMKSECEEIVLPVDAARVQQVLVNLLSNAIKFSSSDSSILVMSEKRGSFVRISVVDSGPGINRQVSAKLFQKFFQTAEGKSAGGTGLGLALAKLIMEAHGGLIGVDSIPGEGSAFWIELPFNQKSSPLNAA